MKQVTLKRIFITFSIACLLTMFTITFILASIILTTGYDPFKRFSSHLATMGISLILLLFTWFFRKKINTFLLTFATVYVFLAVFLGSSLNFYNYYEYLNYDKIIHVYFGYSSAILGLYAFIKFKQYTQSSVLYMIFFIFSFSMMIAAMWEISEFSSDQFFHTITQGYPREVIDGSFVVDVKETMFDMIANLIGTILFLIGLTLEKTKKNTLITKQIVRALLD